jgi:hypothetical protein
MTGSTEIAEILLDILTTGLLRVRALGWSGNAEQCAIEADHIHNVPDLLAHFSSEKLAYYWNIERTCYMTQTPTADLVVWEPMWRQLKAHVEAMACSNSGHEV